MNTVLPPIAPSRKSVGVWGVGRATGRAVVSQLHPKMLLALLLPLGVALVAAVLLVLLFWTPLTTWLHQTMSTFGAVTWADETMTQIGFGSVMLLVKAWLVPLAAVLILLPLSGILGLAVAAVVVMPLVLRHVGERDYPDVQRRGGNGFIGGLWNAIWVTTLFVVGWLVTLPLWLFPPFAILLPLFWWSFAFSRMLRVDALAEHATPAERDLLYKRHNTGFWALGGICSLINLFPPAWFLLPVLSALMFSHYGMEALRRLRSETQL
jgi:hypothetical protein